MDIALGIHHIFRLTVFIINIYHDPPSLLCYNVFYRLTHAPYLAHTCTEFVKTSTPSISTNMSPIDDAIEDLKSQKLGELINYT